MLLTQLLYVHQEIPENHFYFPYPERTTSLPVRVPRRS